MRIASAVERLRPFVGPWLVPLGLLAACLALNIHQARAAGMHRRVPVWVVDAVPVALASMEFGHTADYTGSLQVLGLFRDALKKDPRYTLNQQLKYALDHRAAVPEHRPYLAGYDDKGIIDFLKLGFCLFGYKVRSAISTYFLILGTSSLLFVLRYRREKGVLLLLFGFLLAHACIVPSVALNPHLRSVLALRFMSVLGMVAALHLALEVLLPRPSWWCWPLAVLQAGVLFLVLHIRFTAIWQVICVTGVFAVALGWRLLAAWIKRDGQARPWPTPVPVLLALLAALGLGAYKRTFYSPNYFAMGTEAHIFWHSLYSGLAYSPELAEEYRLRIDDQSVFWATQRFMFAQGRADEWREFGDGCERYERGVRSMFFHTLRERPVAVAQSLLYYKPAALVHYLAWFLRLADRPPSAHVLWDGAEEQLRFMAVQMDGGGKFFQPFRIECVLLLTVFLAWAWRSDWGHWRRGTAAFAAFAACSALPSLLGYPTAHTVGDPLIAVGMALYFGAAASAAGLLRRVFVC